MPYRCSVCDAYRPDHRPETCPLGDPAAQLPLLERQRDEAWRRVEAVWAEMEEVERALGAVRARAAGAR